MGRGRARRVRLESSQRCRARGRARAQFRPERDALLLGRVLREAGADLDRRPVHRRRKPAPRSAVGGHSSSPGRRRRVRGHAVAQSARSALRQHRVVHRPLLRRRVGREPTALGARARCHRGRNVRVAVRRVRDAGFGRKFVRASRRSRRSRLAVCGDRPHLRHHEYPLLRWRLVLRRPGVGGGP